MTSQQIKEAKARIGSSTTDIAGAAKEDLRKLTNEERIARGLKPVGRPRKNQEEQEEAAARINSETAENLRAVANPDEEGYLGRLAWFTISDMRVNIKQLQECFTVAGVDHKHLPKPISDRDAFRRATSDAQAKRIQFTDSADGVVKYINLLVREVAMTTKTITRQLVREVVDSKNVRLDYKPVACLVLNDGILELTPKVSDLFPEEMNALEKIRREYEMARDYYNGRHVRDLVMKALGECAPVAVRPSGGVYFVPIKYEDQVLSLQRLVKELSPYSNTSERSRMWSIPVVDGEDHREMVAESLDDQIVSNTKSLTDEIARVLKSGRKITENLANQYIEKAKAMKTAIKEYEDLLEIQADTARSNMELALRVAKELMKKVEVD